MKRRSTLERNRQAASAPRLELVKPAQHAQEVAKPFAGDPFMICSSTREQTADAVWARVGRLIDCVRKGHIFDAVEEFYAEEVEVGRGALAPMFGFWSGPGNRAHRGKHRGVDAEWRGFHVHGVGVNGDTSFIECSLDFATFGGESFTVNQVAVAQWRDGKIVKECLIPKN